MMLRAQFEESQNPPAAVLSVSSSATQFSLLDNQRIQEGRTEPRDFGHEIDWFLMRAFAAGRPQARLTFLKNQRFRPEGREQRIRASLAALDAPQPTKLTVQQWMEVIEEIEDED
jgi:hypothetical protein